MDRHLNCPKIISFKKILLQKETHGNNTNLLLPKVCTGAGQKSFLFQGSKLYNKLPDVLKQGQSIMNFKRQCDQLDSDLYNIYHMEAFKLDFVI